MNSRIRKNVLRTGLIALALLALVTGLGAPALAASTPVPAVKTVQGTVLSIASDNLSFVVQSGNQAQVTVKVDGNTRYFVVPMGRVTAYVNKEIKEERKDDRKDDRDDKDNKNNKGNNGKNVQSRGSIMKELHIPENWKSNLGWLDTFQTGGKFSDIEVGDRVVARVSTEGVARQVLIVKAPAIQQVRGTITAIAAGSITITPATGAAVTLTANAKTSLTIKGSLLPQVGQSAIAVYNRKTMVAQTIKINTSSAPVPPATLTSIAVNPAAPATLPIGLTQQFTATATYSNGTNANVTSSVTWNSSNTTVASIAAGLAAGLSAGSTQITASMSGVTSPAVTLTVVAATVSSIAVTPAAPANLTAGLTQQFTATAYYSNGTNSNVTSSASWGSSNTTVATVSASGLATGVAAGTTLITAALPGATSPAVTLTVVAPTLSSITVTPGTPANLHIGATQAFAATAAYSNGSNVVVTTSVTWASSNTTVASIVTSGATIGTATGLAAGTTQITAVMSGVTSAPVSLTVIP